MIQIYDTTLRDGAQGVGVNFSLEDKLIAAQKIDELGVAYIEGGWPHKNNLKEIEFFKQIKKFNLKAKIVAFGSTKKIGNQASEDPFLNDLLTAQTEAIAIFGKSWDLHVTDVLRVSLEDNLKMIKESVAFLKSQNKEVIYDAEHFFDGYKANPEYALQTILAAEAGGADTIVLCDTNGGSLPSEVEQIIKDVKNKIKIKLGIHCHNDIGLAVANSLTAVQNGVNQVHGTINGYGERCGNTDLCSLIPNLQLKLGRPCVSRQQLAQLKDISIAIAELANQEPFKYQPYVSSYAFAHKGGMHIDAVLKNKSTFEHINPALVGNSSNLLVSEQAGRGVIVDKLKELGVDYDKNSPVVEKILLTVKTKESQGYAYELATASLKLLFLSLLDKLNKPFVLDNYKIDTQQVAGKEIESSAKACVRVGDNLECSQASGNGPVNAVDLALRQVLLKFYPDLSSVELVDYKVRVLSGQDGTAARVRVLIEFNNQGKKWITVGVSTNSIEASLQALIEGYYYIILGF